jgi:hypothetical protein
MTQYPLDFGTGESADFDFSDPASAVYGPQHIIQYGVRILAPGDTNHDGMIDAAQEGATSDKKEVTLCIANVCDLPYSIWDLNASGYVNATDVSMVNFAVFTLTGVGLGIAYEQVP